MAGFEIDCGCGAKVRIPDPAPGGAVRCAACGIEFEVMPVGELGAGGFEASDQVEFACVCGARAKLPLASLGSHFQCDACGIELPILGGAATSGAPPGARARTDAFSLPTPELPGEGAATPLRCPFCGGQAEIAWAGPDGRDRMLVCRYCRSASDLPEARGVTREKVVERPGETIRESVTRWEGSAPGAGHAAVGGEDHVVERVLVDDESFHFGGDDLASEAALAARLREVLPEDVADRVLGEVRHGLAHGPDGSPRDGTFESVRVEVETSDDADAKPGLWQRLRSGRRKG